MATVLLSKALPRDSNSHPIQVAQHLNFVDAGTVYSPKASVGTSGQAFAVPAGALAMVFNADATAYVNASGTFDGTHGYQKVVANADFCYPCSDIAQAGGSIYIAAATGTVTVYFHFEMGA